LLVFICSLSLFVLNIPAFINTDLDENWVSLLCCLSPILILFPIGIISTIIGLKSKDKIRAKNLSARQENKVKIDKWHMHNQRILDRWQSAINRWENLYYCHRDDCVFVPGKGTYAPIEEYYKYLYE